MVRGTGRTVATGCGRTASEASLGVTDTERVSTTAFLSKIRPDWADAGLFRGFLPPSYLLLSLSTCHHPLLG